eukprot:12764704-Alexandrium_andersonii.AAC.1
MPRATCLRYPPSTPAPRPRTSPILITRVALSYHMAPANGQEPGKWKQFHDEQSRKTVARSSDCCWLHFGGLGRGPHSHPWES